MPVSAQARMHRMFRDARVTARWEPVPSPKKIRQGVTKATRRLFYERFEGAEFSEAELTYAQNLLEKHPPAQVVSLLLRMSEPALPREPFEIAQAEPRAWDAPAPTNRPRLNAAPESRPPRSNSGAPDSAHIARPSWPGSAARKPALSARGEEPTQDGSAIYSSGNRE